jgi:hypothetical protein
MKINLPFIKKIDKNKFKIDELCYKIKYLDEEADNLKQYNLYELKQIYKLLSAGVRFEEINKSMIDNCDLYLWAIYTGNVKKEGLNQ